MCWDLLDPSRRLSGTGGKGIPNKCLTQEKAWCTWETECLAERWRHTEDTGLCSSRAGGDECCSLGRKTVGSDSGSTRCVGLIKLPLCFNFLISNIDRTSHLGSCEVYWVKICNLVFFFIIFIRFILSVLKCYCRILTLSDIIRTLSDLSFKSSLQLLLLLEKVLMEI